MPEIPPQDDPVTSRPMSLLVLVSAFILLLTVAWSLYSEFFGLRPWRSYQDQFRVRVFGLSAEADRPAPRPTNRLFTPRPTIRS